MDCDDCGHPLTCRANTNNDGRRRHDAIVRLLHSLVIKTTGYAAMEVHPLGGDNRRPDLHAAYATNNDLVDVVVVHPLARSYLRAARTRYGAALRVARNKTTKYRNYAQEVNAHFVPFACETLGGVVPAARKWLAHVTFSMAPDQVTPEGLDSQQLLHQAQAAIAVALQRGNAAMIKAAVNRALPGPRRTAPPATAPAGRPGAPS